MINLNDRYVKSYMEIAKTVSHMSYAMRLKVGSVIVNLRNNRIVATGFNGTPRGFPNECEELIDGVMVTKDCVIHAEQNALMSIARSTESTEDCAIFVTHSPCIQCAKLIQASGITHVYYHHDYRDPAGLNYLREYGVLVEKVD